MEDDEEEDVMLQNGPLHLYLNECEEVCMNLLDNELDVLHINHQVNPSTILEEPGPNHIVSVSPQAKPSVGDPNYSTKQSRGLNRSKSFNAVLDSNLLEKDDLELLVGTSILRDYKPYSNRSWYIFGIVVPVLISILYLWSSYQIFIISLMLLVLSSFLYFCIAWMSYKSSMEHLIVSFMSLDKIIGESLKLMRQREALDRGYTTLSSKTVSSGFPLVGFSQHFSNVLMDLRQSLYSVLKEIISTLQQECFNLKNKDCDLHLSVSTISLDDLFELIGIDFTNNDACLQSNSLKGIHQFFCLQRSEYLRILCTTSMSLHSDRVKLIQHVQSCTKRLQKDYSMHIPWQTLLDARNKTIPPSNKTIPCKISEDQESPASLSLCLHLQRALEISLSLTDTPPSRLSQYDLETVETALKCSLTCLYEIRDLLYPIVKNNPHPGFENDKKGKHSKNVDLESNNTKLGPVLEEIGDQVFETVIEDSKTIVNSSCDKECLMSAVYGKQNVGRVLGELKTVLKGRSKVMRQREAIALAAFKGVDVQVIEDQFQQEDLEREQVPDKMAKQNDVENNENEPRDTVERQTVHTDLKSELRHMFQSQFANRNPETCLGDSSSDSEHS